MLLYTISGGLQRRIIYVLISDVQWTGSSHVLRPFCTATSRSAVQNGSRTCSKTAIAARWCTCSPTQQQQLDERLGCTSAPKIVRFISRYSARRTTIRQRTWAARRVASAAVDACGPANANFMRHYRSRRQDRCASLTDGLYVRSRRTAASARNHPTRPTLSKRLRGYWHLPVTGVVYERRERRSERRGVRWTDDIAGAGGQAAPSRLGCGDCAEVVGERETDYVD